MVSSIIGVRRSWMTVIRTLQDIDITLMGRYEYIWSVDYRA